MVDSYAACIQRGLIRVDACELRRKSVRGYDTIRKRKCIQQGCERRRGGVSDRCRRNIEHGALRKSKPCALIGHEEKSSILPDTTAQETAKIIVTFSGAIFARSIRKPVVRVKHVVAEIL